jgi:hypothetical protein
MNDNSTTGSETNLDLAASWLRDCTETHENCYHRPQMEPVLPLRVLDIGGPESPQNICLSQGQEGEKRVGSYAALSYCWGTNLPYRTMRENIDELKKGFPAARLPKTFTDAICVCRHLGIRFLWIDSMCIIQNDEEDWDVQSRLMGHIYSNAVLTIIAAVGEDSDAGLFVDRDPRKTYPCVLNWQYTNKDGHNGTSTVIPCQDLEQKKESYLDTRGWTFQEKYLSRRSLRFSRSGMHWDCASNIASEGFPMGMQPSNHKSDFDKYIRADGNSMLQTRVDSEQRYNWWYLAVEMYSYRTFTRESDRLRALSGLASRFQDLQDGFLYGIWRSDITRGLAWRISGNNGNYSPDTYSGPPSSPSWSWASRPGNLITYSDAESPRLTEMDINESLTNPSTRSLPSQQLSFLDILSVGSTDSTTATRTSGVLTCESLRIRGLLLEARPEESSGSKLDSEWATYDSLRVFKPCSHPKRMYKEFSGIAFYDEPVTKDDKLYCLPLFPDTKRSRDQSSSLGPNAQLSKKLYEERNDTQIAFDQKTYLETGGGMLPCMTWCGGPTTCCVLEIEDILHCLILMKIEGKEMRFRRVGYTEIRYGQFFEEVIPITLEIV